VFEVAIIMFILFPLVLLSG